MQEVLIRLLRTLSDPEDGESAVELALRKEDASLVGLWGDRAPDVVCFTRPGYVLEGVPLRLPAAQVPDGDVSQLRPLALPPPSAALHADFLPSAALGEHHSNRAVFVCAGPGIRHVPYERWPARPPRLVDVAPTICHLLGAPPPRDTDGRVLAEFFSR